ncbi:MAG TPA: hypothetical protein VHU40_21800 [Polyangia bacterium]|nr:hypothetical protein [Polyangia bacterium]
MKVIRQGRRVALVAVLALGGVAFQAAPAAASIVQALELPDLVQKADHIAVVDVVSKRSEWDAKHEQIFSTVELKIVERWKGPGQATEGTLTVIQPGGTVGDLTMTVTGLTSFTPGERAVVFLRGTPDNARLLGLSQGKRPMQFDAGARTWWIRQAPQRDLTLVKTQNAGSGKVAPTLVQPARPQQMVLEDFRAEVRALIGSGTSPR